MRDYDGPSTFAATPIGKGWGHQLFSSSETFREVAEEIEDESIF